MGLFYGDDDIIVFIVYDFDMEYVDDIDEVEMEEMFGFSDLDDDGIVMIVEVEEMIFVLVVFMIFGVFVFDSNNLIDSLDENLWFVK